MVRIICGRCKEEIHFHPMQQAIFPSYMITKVSGNSVVGTVNLCPDCEKKFQMWLNKEGED